MAAQPASAAAAKALAAVVQAEQVRTLKRMATLRLVAVSVGCLAMLLAPPPPGIDVSPSIYGGLVYLVVAVGIFVLVVVRKNLGPWSAYSVALVDLPVMLTIQYFQARIIDDPTFVLPGNIGLMLAFIAGAMLSMSRSVVIATWVSAQIGLTLITYPRVLLVPFVLVSIALAALAIAGYVMVGRVSQLVIESRKKDLLGKYVLGARLGAGGMAEVFQATYSPEGGFERRVAVKRILPSYADNPEFVSLFRREAELGATLAHPNIVQVLDFGSDSSTYFLAMEFIDGLPAGRLITALRTKGALLPLSSVVWLAAGVAEALNYIHTRVGPNNEPMRLVHRDLNPPNIMVSRNGEVKLADFGIAKSDRSDNQTRSGMVRGKLGYTAPEQLMGQPYDGRADLFALGASLYELLTNTRLFHAEDDIERLSAVLKKPVAPPSVVRPEVTPALDAIVLGLVERNPDQRTPSAAVLLQQLSALDPALFNPTTGRNALSAEVIDALSKGAGPAQVSSNVSIEMKSKTDRLGANDATAELKSPPTR